MPTPKLNTKLAYPLESNRITFVSQISLPPDTTEETSESPGVHQDRILLVGNPNGVSFTLVFGIKKYFSALKSTPPNASHLSTVFADVIWDVEPHKLDSLVRDFRKYGIPDHKTIKLILQKTKYNAGDISSSNWKQLHRSQVTLDTLMEGLDRGVGEMPSEIVIPHKPAWIQGKVSPVTAEMIEDYKRSKKSSKRHHPTAETPTVEMRLVFPRMVHLQVMKDLESLQSSGKADSTWEIVALALRELVGRRES